MYSFTLNHIYLYARNIIYWDYIYTLQKLVSKVLYFSFILKLAIRKSHSTYCLLQNTNSVLFFLFNFKEVANQCQQEQWVMLMSKAGQRKRQILGRPLGYSKQPPTSSRPQLTSENVGPSFVALFHKAQSCRVVLGGIPWYLNVGHRHRLV